MKNFTSVKDIPSIEEALKVAFDVKKNKFAYQHLGKNKTMVLIFLNQVLFNFEKFLSNMMPA